MKLPIVQQLAQPYIKGLHLGSYTYLFSHILDHTISKKNTIDLIKNNPSLFNQCSVSNFVNLIGITPFYYIFVDKFLIIDKTLGLQPLKILAILTLHNILFYTTHFSFHFFKPLRYIHHFHHKFNQPIPSSGNAVSITEYNMAYVLPFLISAFLFKPNDISFRVSIGIIGFLNSLIHCIPLSDISIGKYFIKPGDHIEHHQKRTVKYAAPLINIDYIISLITLFFQDKKLQYFNGFGI